MLDQFLHRVGIADAEIRERPNGAAFLKVARSVYPLTCIIYSAVNIPVGSGQASFMHCSHSDQWVKHSVSRSAIAPARLDEYGDMFANPVDWTGADTVLAADLPRARQMFSFPLRTSHGETAAMYVAGNMGEDEWLVQRDHAKREFEVLGNYFHQHMLRISGQNADKGMLVSARELDCLKWMAVGKTAWEASVILGISERTVRFHLNAAREKLDCLTTTQAVAKAVSHQLIVV